MEYLDVINSFNTSDIGLISIISQKLLKWQDNTSPLTPTFKSTDMADVYAHRSQNEKKIQRNYFRSYKNIASQMADDDVDVDEQLLA